MDPKQGIVLGKLDDLLDRLARDRLTLRFEPGVEGIVGTSKISERVSLGLKGAKKVRGEPAISVSWRAG
jgi:hypothetical protein